MGDYHTLTSGLTQDNRYIVQGWALYSRQRGSKWNATDLPEITTNRFASNEIVSLHKSLSKHLQEQPKSCELTNRLRTAVEGIMNHLMSTQDVSITEEGALTTGKLAWTISIIRQYLKDTPHEDEDTFCDLTVGVSRLDADGEGIPQNNVNWKVDADEIKSILDLCVFSIVSKTEKPPNYPLPSGVSQGSAYDESLKSGSYFRILSQLRLDDDRNNTLGNWISFHSFLPTLDGLRHSQALETLLDRQSMFTTSDNVEHNKELPNFPIQLRHCGLREALALELLNLFLLAISSQISQINGMTQINTDPGFNNGEGLVHREEALKPQWTNTAINEISSCIVNAGLVESLDEANTFVIPALYQYDLLPKEPGPTIVNSSPGQSEEDSSTVGRDPPSGSRHSTPDHDELTNTTPSRADTAACPLHTNGDST